MKPGKIKSHHPVLTQSDILSLEIRDKQRLKRLQALYEMGQTVTSSLNLETVFQQVLEQVVSVVHATGASILLPDAEGLSFAAACGEGAEKLVGQHVPLEGSVAGRVFQNGKALLISDAIVSQSVHHSSAKSISQQVGSLLAAPLLLQNRVLGVMEAVHIEPRRFGEADLQLLETAASWAAIAISNARQHEAVKQQLLEKNKLHLARQAADAASLAKSEFLANMSHEIRTPLNAILGFTYLALKSEANPQQSDYLSKIQASAYALLGTIEGILKLSKLEAVQIEIESAPFRLDKVLNNVLNLMKAKAYEKGLDLALDLSAAAPVALVGDALQLRDLLVSLIGNAVKFTEKGGVSISVEPVNFENGAVTLAFAIRDTGIGIAPEQLEDLFQPFHQMDNSRTRKYGGVGLGLAISKRLVDMMGGQIEVGSLPGAGATFTLKLPFLLQLEHSKSQVAPAILGKLRVLVVEDDPEACTIYENMLHGMKFAVSFLNSELGALAELERAIRNGEQPYDLIILDWTTPDMDTLDIVRRIKTDPLLPQAPAMIVTTPPGREELLHQVEELQVDGSLIKPLTSSMLLDAIQDIFWLRNSQDERFSLPDTATVQTGFAPETHILLVEDNDINRMMVRTFLSNVGLKVLDARDGYAAVQMAIQNASKLSAILMDIALPVMNGYEAARQIKSHPDCQHIPIIAMTANAMTGDREKSLAAGMKAHLTKPVNVQELLATLSYWILGKPDLASEPLPASEEIFGTPHLSGDAEFEALRSRLLELKSLLEQHDVEALALAEQIQKPSGDGILKNQLQQLQVLLRRYDFGAALEQVNQFLQVRG